MAAGSHNRAGRGDMRQREKPLLVSHGGPAESRALLPLPTCQNEGCQRVIPSLTKR